MEKVNVIDVELKEEAPDVKVEIESEETVDVKKECYIEEMKMDGSQTTQKSKSKPTVTDCSTSLRKKFNTGFYRAT